METKSHTFCIKQYKEHVLRNGSVQLEEKGKKVSAVWRFVGLR